MANLIPTFRHMLFNVGKRARRAKGHGLACHIAVSELAALRPYPGADWHAYIPKRGPAIQMLDLDLQAWTTGDGNYRMASFESQGGVVNANSEPWAEDQCENIARMYAYLHESEGAPLQLMPDSRASSKGLGYHRLGIDPWRVSRGEVWSKHRGKICPGQAKISQLPDILDRAIQIVRGSSTPNLTDNTDKVTAPNIPGYYSDKEIDMFLIYDQRYGVFWAITADFTSKSMIHPNDREVVEAGWAAAGVKYGGVRVMTTDTIDRIPDVSSRPVIRIEGPQQVDVIGDGLGDA